MKQILTTLFEQKRLSKQEAKQILIDIAQENYKPAEIASFITVFLMRPIAVEELSGFREALLELATFVDFSDYNTIDLCGTGGDGKNTFNISTLTSFIVAGTGNMVTKHGNYGSSSASGSSNVLEQLGYTFTNDESLLKRQLEEAKICFLHAPKFHPAMKVVAPIRKELKLKTFFNLLGPLVNPARPKNQLVGVFNLEVARIYNYILQDSGINYGVVYSIDGYDEVSLTSDFKLFTSTSEQQFAPKDLGLNRIQQTAIYGGETVNAATKIFKQILNKEGTEEQNNVVLTNSALALQVLDKSKSFQDAFEEAKESLFAGKAKESLEKLLQIT